MTQNGINIVVMNGDLIGNEVVPAMRKVVDAAVEACGYWPINWIKAFIGESAIKEGFNSNLPRCTLNLIKEHKVAIKGPTHVTDDMKNHGLASANVRLRKELDLFANIRPVRSFLGVPSRYENIDIVMIRENTEGLYGGTEFYIVNKKGKRVGGALRIISDEACERICRAAFQYAVINKRHKVTAFHKENILSLTDGIFLENFRAVAKEFPSMEATDLIVDNASMQLVVNPHQFDVIVTTNMFGDIKSDHCAGLVGGLGVAPGANIGEKLAVFEAVHGTAPDIAGKGIANPSAMILSAVMMLKHLGMPVVAKTIENALSSVLKEGIYVTGDINKVKPVNTEQMTHAIIEEIRKSS